jgi:T5orf172 domain
MTNLPVISTYCPPYQTLDTLAENLDVSVEELQGLIASGDFPKPRSRKQRKDLWSWAEVCDFFNRTLPEPRYNREDGLGSVYIIGFADYVKIGFTRNFRGRMTELRVAMPEDPTVYGLIRGVEPIEEARMHHRFEKYWLRREWFRKEGELAAWIEAGCPK